MGVTVFLRHVKTLLWILLAFFLTTFINFMLAEQAPVRPEDAFIGQQLENFQTQLASSNLAQSHGSASIESSATFFRYLRFIKRYFYGDFGWSQTFGAPVQEVIKKPFLFSFSLSLVSLCFSYGFALLVMWIYLLSGDRVQQGLYFIFCFLQALPKLFVAMLLILVFSSDMGFQIFSLNRGFGQSPANSFFGEAAELTRSLVLPVLTLVIVYTPKIFLYFCGMLLKQNTLKSVEFLRGSGCTETEIFWLLRLRIFIKDLRWRFVNDMVFLLFAYGFIIEIIFALPGMGYLGYQAIISGDHDLYIGIFFSFTCLNMLLNLLFTPSRQLKGGGA